MTWGERGSRWNRLWRVSWRCWFFENHAFVTWERWDRYPSSTKPIRAKREKKNKSLCPIRGGLDSAAAACHAWLHWKGEKLLLYSQPPVFHREATSRPSAGRAHSRTVTRFHWLPRWPQSCKHPWIANNIIFRVYQCFFIGNALAASSTSASSSTQFRRLRDLLRFHNLLLHFTDMHHDHRYSEK